MPKYKIGFVLDEYELLNSPPDKPNTSFLIMKECCSRNHQIYAILIKNLILNNNKPEACAYMINADDFHGKYNRNINNQCYISLNDLDMILVRQNPPVNMDYIFCTYILDYVDKSKTIVINDPSGIRKANEKLYINNFPEITPKSIVTSNISLIKSFLNQYNEIIIKPLDNFGGNGVFYLKEKDKNLNTILENATNNENKLVLAQEYLCNVKYGDKRLVLLGGEPIAAINRFPSEYDFRANMCKGGYLEKGIITDEDREICKKISKNLLQDGLFFVGLDIIDNKLIEINVTSPGFFISIINPMWNIKLEKIVVDYIESLRIKNNEYYKL
ncbi:MAG: glutathione synthase [bacterium]